MPKIVDPEERRKAVAAAVFRVVVRDGLENASLRNVADEAGLAIGSVRHYFAGHEELMLFAVRELVDSSSQRLLAHVRTMERAQEEAGGASSGTAAADTSGAAGERGESTGGDGAGGAAPVDMRAFVETMLAEMLPLDADRYAETVVWLEFAAAARTRPALRAEVYRIYDGSRMIMSRIVERGRASGRFPGSLDPEVEADRLMSLVNGIAVDMVLHAERLSAERGLAVLRRHLDGLSAEPPA